MVGLSENYLNRVDELRMRDRNDLVCLDVKINDVSQPHGWLKQAKMNAATREPRLRVDQRRARNVRALGCAGHGWTRCSLTWTQATCRWVCFILAKLPHAHGRMHVEDVQDISMSQITYNSEHRLINCSTVTKFWGPSLTTS